MTLIFFFKRRREERERAEAEHRWRMEGRNLDIDQTQGIKNLVQLQTEQNAKIDKLVEIQSQQAAKMDKMIELFGQMVEDNRSLKEDNKALVQQVQKVEQENQELKQAIVLIKSSNPDPERFFQAVEVMLERVLSIEYRCDWMLDYHRDENERFGTLRSILPDLLKDRESSTTASSSAWGTTETGEQVENSITGQEGSGAWGQHREEQETSWDQDSAVEEEGQGQEHR